MLNTRRMCDLCLKRWSVLVEKLLSRILSSAAGLQGEWFGGFKLPFTNTN